MPREAAINALLEERATAVTRLRELIDVAESEERDFTSEEQQEYENVENNIVQLGDRAKRLERADQLERTLDDPEAERRRREVHPDNPELDPDREPDDENRAVVTSLREYRERRAREQGKRPQDTDEYREAWYRLMTVPSLQDVHDNEWRALSKATAAAGANLVPTEFFNELIQSLRDFGITRELARVITTDSGESIQFPSVTTHGTAAWVAENGSYTESDEAFGQVTLSAYKAGTMIKVSEELLVDSAFELEAYITEEFGQRIGVLENTAYVVGDGSGKPTGYQPNVTTGKTGTTGQTVSITYDDLIDLVHSVPIPYRRNGKFVTNDLSIAKLRKLKDANLLPMWQPSMQAGQPDTLLGFPIFSDPDIPVMAANVKSVIFGDFRRGYLIRDVNGIAFQRLNELFAANGQIGFRAYHRTDGKIVNAAALRAYANSAT